MITARSFYTGSHNDDHTDAHAHDHAHDSPLGVDTSAPVHPLHGHPSHPDISPNQSLAGIENDVRASANEKRFKDVEASDNESTVNQMPSSAEAAAQLIAVGVLEFGVMLHR